MNPITAPRTNQSKAVLLSETLARLGSRVALLETLIAGLRGVNEVPTAKEAQNPTHFEYVYTNAPGYLEEQIARLDKAMEILSDMLI